MSKKVSNAKMVDNQEKTSGLVFIEPCITYGIKREQGSTSKVLVSSQRHFPFMVVPCSHIKPEIRSEERVIYYGIPVAATIPHVVQPHQDATL
jgi:hypothetical protein